MTSQVLLPDPLLPGLCLTKDTRSQNQACLETLQPCLKLETQSSREKGERRHGSSPALPLSARLQAAQVARAQESVAEGVKQPNGRAEVWAKRPGEG